MSLVCVTAMMADAEGAQWVVAIGEEDRWSASYDGSERSLNSAGLRTLLRLKLMAAADRWLVPARHQPSAPEDPLGVFEATVLLSAHRDEDPAVLERARECTGVRITPPWLSAADQITGRVVVLARTATQVHATIDVYATPEGWLSLRVCDEQLQARLIDDLTLQALIDHCVPEPEKAS